MIQKKKDDREAKKWKGDANGEIYFIIYGLKLIDSKNISAYFTYFNISLVSSS